MSGGSTCSSWARGASHHMGVAPLQMAPGKRCTGFFGEVPMPGYLPYDPLLPTAPMPLAA